ncbi:homocysteine S-methyltransferase family protein [Taklimakanibacter lacteus]|uniref:homocysteine S-methyltransferase family protein n=1 Tax=Taklimakanibacter lacteus TaxID=2268456 RepID=UPI0013C536AD
MTYAPIARKLTRGDIIILDGGTGTDIQSRGVPMAGETWCAEANLTHPAVVRCVHEDYIEAGAEIVTANTYATSPLLFNALGRDEDLIRIDREAVRIAREAAQGRAAVAGSFSVMRPMDQGVDRVKKYREWSEKDARALMRRKAQSMADAGVDLIMMEMMRDADYSLWATEAAVETGLPVWAGISTEPGEDGKLTGFARPDWPLGDIVKALAGTGADVISIMHTLPNHTGDALKVVRETWQGPLGAYPESGFFKMPDWQFVDIIEPTALVTYAQDWRKMGASIFGGCCGTNPQHIKALSTALRRAA